MVPPTTSFRRVATCYGIALAALAIAALVTLSVVQIYSLISPNVARLVVSTTFLLAILSAAWWGGYGPGILATITSILFAPYLAVRGYTPAHANFMQLGLVLLISILISRIKSTQEKEQSALRRSNEELDEKVRERTAELQRAYEALQEREAMLVKQAEELGRSNVDLQQFAYIASHDLQEPLRMVSIYTELLAQRCHGRFGEETDGFIGVVLEGVKRMDNLIRDLLSYSRAVHAESIDIETFDAAYAVSTAVDNLEAAIVESHAQIEYENLPVVTFNRVQLAQVFQNLIGNSVKYRTSAPKISISAKADGANWTFSVKDNGLGIAAEHHESIFEPFKRLHGREYPGSGVGLAICRRIIERHGGKIWIESKAGEGTTFRFTIAQKAQVSPARRAITSPASL